MKFTLNHLDASYLYRLSPPVNTGMYLFCYQLDSVLIYNNKNTTLKCVLKFHAFTQTFNELIKPSFLFFSSVAVHFFPVLFPELFSGCQLLWRHTLKCVSIYINYIIMVNPNFSFIIQWYCFASPMTPDFREFALVHKGTHYKSMVKFRKGR